MRKRRLTKFKNDQISIYEDDCIKTLRKISDGSVSLVVTSPPYCMGKEYEDVHDDTESFKKLNTRVIKQANRILKKGGSLCWQVGYHVSHSSIVPLDFLIFEIIKSINRGLTKENRFYLHNRIIWTFGHGLNSEKRLSGRHEMILWFSKGEQYTFNLDPIRIPQKYPGKTYWKGPKRGLPSGNPLGKNPGDIWDIPNVKKWHPEKTEHPCQFPIVIPQKLIKALTNENDLVVDPFMGSGTTAIACLIENRRFIGSDNSEKYIRITKERIMNAIKGDLPYRPDFPVMAPDPKSKVAKKPSGFKW